MLPKINNVSTDGIKKENIASRLIVEDHMRGMLAKSQNISYKPWKSKYAPKNPESPFGNFPKELHGKSLKTKKIDQNHEESQAQTMNSIELI